MIHICNGCGPNMKQKNSPFAVEGPISLIMLQAYYNSRKLLALCATAHHCTQGPLANVEDVDKDIKEGLRDVDREMKGTLVGGGKEVKVVENGELAGKEVKGSLQAAGRGHSQFGHKETQKAKLNGLHKKVGGQTIEVHSGDTLWGIARKYGVRLRNQNHLDVLTEFL